MSRTRWLTKSGIIIALAVGSTACAWRRTPVPVYSDSGVSALVGDWSGDYSSRDTGRSGSITFQLASSQDTAYGDVIMIPWKRDVAAVREEQAQTTVATTQKSAEPLTIRFVRMEGDRVSGRLAAYKDPDCGCTVVTTFEGKFVNRNMIQGTFHTRGTDLGHIPADGKWKVFRQASRSTTPED